MVALPLRVISVERIWRLRGLPLCPFLDQIGMCMSLGAIMNALPLTTLPIRAPANTWKDV